MLLFINKQGAIPSILSCEIREELRMEQEIVTESIKF